MDDHDIAAMAREAASAAWHVRHHKALRNSLRCEREHEHEVQMGAWVFNGEVGPESYGSGPPCWKLVESTHDTGNYDGPQTFTTVDPWGGACDEWCDACRDRQQHHEELMRWVPIASAAKGRLTRALDAEAGRPGAGILVGVIR